MIHEDGSGLPDLRTLNLRFRKDSHRVDFVVFRYDFRAPGDSVGFESLELLALVVGHDISVSIGLKVINSSVFSDQRGIYQAFVWL